MGKEHLLQMYTDLTPARYEVLKAAEAGTLKKMNGAMHESISNMVDSNYHITFFGSNVLARANRIMEGDGELHSPLPPEVVDYLRDVNTRKIAKMMRPINPFMSSCHVKLLIALDTYPSQAYRYLGHIYGYSTITDLEHSGFIGGGAETGCSWFLMKPAMTLHQLLTLSSMGKR